MRVRLTALYGESVPSFLGPPCSRSPTCSSFTPGFIDITTATDGNLGWRRVRSRLSTPLVCISCWSSPGSRWRSWRSLSVALGWLVAGRVLRPLRTMTAATRRISEDNLHERLALPGPTTSSRTSPTRSTTCSARLEAAFEAQRRFVANASHELRTPLAMMRTSLDVATASPDRSRRSWRRSTAKVREGLDQADRLVESFLVAGSRQHGTGRRREHGVARRGRRRGAGRARDASSRRALTVEQDGGAPVAWRQRTLLARMVENLIDNAIRHNQPGGWIRVATVDGSRPRLIVENGGPLLDAREVRSSPEPFRRLGADRTGSENGVGLGLSIVAAIATAHDGTLELSARAEGGLRVAVALPARAARSRPECGMRVLVVEDVPAGGRHRRRPARPRHGRRRRLRRARRCGQARPQPLRRRRPRPRPARHPRRRAMPDDHRGDEPAMVLMLTAAGAPGDGSAVSGSAPTTTWPSRSTSPSLSCASARSPAATRRPGPHLAAAGRTRPLRGTRPRDGRRATCRRRSSLSSRR